MKIQKDMFSRKISEDNLITIFCRVTFCLPTGGRNGVTRVKTSISMKHRVIFALMVITTVVSTDQIRIDQTKFPLTTMSLSRTTVSSRQYSFYSLLYTHKQCSPRPLVAPRLPPFL